jgi:hypothetical protein
MKVPASVKPAVWGAVAGAIAAIVVGFGWGGWVTGGTAVGMKADSAEAAIVLAMTPLCLGKATAQPEQLAQLKEESRWRRSNFVIDAGWVSDVSEQYRTAVARECAVAAMEIEAAPATTAAQPAS